MKIRTNERLNFFINKIGLIVSALFTFLLFINLSNSWYGKAAVITIGLLMEVAKWPTLAAWKRDKKKVWLLAMYLIAFLGSMLSRLSR